MWSKDDRGALDTTSLRMRAATFAAGVWLTYVVCGASMAYLLLTWGRPNRTLLLLLFLAGLGGAAAIAQLPRERIVGSRYREAFFLAWSVLDLSLIAVGTLADGGTHSPLALIFFIPIVFSSMSYPLGSVLFVGALTVSCYLVLAVTLGGASTSYEALFAVMLGCTGAMSAWQAGNHARQRQALMEVSRTDPLTGCLNRRGFEERALAQIAAAGRCHGAGAVLLLDVDHLKRVNDRKGHAAGDELLRRVVSTLAQTVRPNDAIGRLGGDEFAVLFGAIAPTAAAESSARVAATLAQSAPCSVGLATFPTDGTDFEELMRHADARLYSTRRDRRERAGLPPSGQAASEPIVCRPGARTRVLGTA